MITNRQAPMINNTIAKITTGMIMYVFDTPDRCFVTATPSPPLQGPRPSYEPDWTGNSVSRASFRSGFTLSPSSSTSSETNFSLNGKSQSSNGTVEESNWNLQITEPSVNETTLMLLEFTSKYSASLESNCNLMLKSLENFS